MKKSILVTALACAASSPLWAGGLKSPLFSDKLIYAFGFCCMTLLLLSIFFSYRYKRTGKFIFFVLGCLLTIPFLLAAIFCLMNFNNVLILGIIFLLPCIINGLLIANVEATHQ
jgi:hypothetical protein